MSKYIVIHNGAEIRHIEQIDHDFTAQDVLVIDEIPKAHPPEGMREG